MKYTYVHFLKYYTRYYPSKARLHKKIDEKVIDRDQRALIKNELEPFLAEKPILEDRVRNLALAGKSAYLIRSSLLQKGFLKSDIQSVLNACEEIRDVSIYETVYHPKIDMWIQRGKSKYEIKQKLQVGEGMMHVLVTYLESRYTDEIEREIIEGHILDLRERGLDTKKIYQKLSRRGFLYGSIRAVFDSIE